MKESNRMIDAAVAAGFTHAAVVDTAEIPFEPAFRVCCEDNLCGNYNANYACPPACGTVEEMAERIRSRKKALVLQTLWEIEDVMDMTQIKPAKKAHNRMQRSLLESFGPELPNGFSVGVSACDFCSRCAILDGVPCRIPEQQFSCMSAYCIYVKKLADLCGMEYDCGRGLVAFFSMYVFDEEGLG